MGYREYRKICDEIVRLQEELNEIEREIETIEKIREKASAFLVGRKGLEKMEKRGGAAWDESFAIHNILR